MCQGNQKGCCLQEKYRLPIWLQQHSQYRRVQNGWQTKTLGEVYGKRKAAYMDVWENFPHKKQGNQGLFFPQTPHIPWKNIRT